MQVVLVEEVLESRPPDSRAHTFNFLFTVGIYICHSDLDSYLLFTDEGIETLRGKVTSSKLQNKLAIEVIFLLMNTNKFADKDVQGEFWFIIIVIQMTRLNKCYRDSTHCFYLK